VIELIDVSLYQPSVDWRRVAAAGIAGAYCRTHTGSHVDDTGIRHRAAHAGAATLDRALVDDATRLPIACWTCAASVASAKACGVEVCR
jgi:hypothetical protein